MGFNLGVRVLWIAILASLAGWLFAAPVLQAGDRLRLTSETEPSLNVLRTVSAQGAIEVPVVGAVVVAGLGPTEAASLVIEAWNTRTGTIETRLTIDVLDRERAEIEVYGAVSTPVRLVHREDLTLAEAMDAAKPTLAANLAAVRVLEPGRPEEVVDARVSARRLLAPGSVVVVPIADSGSDAIVVGGVRKPGAVRLSSGLTVGQLLEAAGGPTPAAVAGRAELMRGPDLIPIDLGDPSSVGRAVRPGDVLRVPLLAPERTVSVHGAVGRSGVHPLQPQATLRQVLGLAGGPRVWAATDRIRIRRVVGGRVRVFTKSLSVEPGFVLEPGDLVDVPVNPRAFLPAMPQRNHPIPPEATQ